jgi:hypothetical protein
MNYGSPVQWMPGITLEQMEKSIIQAAFRFYRENKTQTASALGIAIRTLDSKLEKYANDDQLEKDKLEARKQTDRETLARFRGPELTRQFSTGSSAQWAAPGASGANEGGQENPSEANSANAASGDETSSGVRVQSSPEAGPKPGVSMPKRQEVQSVLPRSASSNRAGGRR